MALTRLQRLQRLQLRNLEFRDYASVIAEWFQNWIGRKASLVELTHLDVRSDSCPVIKALGISWLTSNDTVKLSKLFMRAVMKSCGLDVFLLSTAAKVFDPLTTTQER